MQTGCMLRGSAPLCSGLIWLRRPLRWLGRCFHDPSGNGTRTSFMRLGSCDPGQSRPIGLELDYPRPSGTGSG
eukprot:6209011-Pleurochrysis_carterae.AAC.6